MSGKSRSLSNLKTLMLIAMITVVSFHALRTVADPDFFWHLKTGEWIWEHKSLPGNDPFAFTTSPAYSIGKHFLLTAYWLGQLIMYMFYRMTGMPGIVLLRFILLGLLAYVMMRRVRGDKVLHYGLIIILLAQLLEDAASYDKPVTFSILFFAVLLYLLERIRAGEIRRSFASYAPLSLLMLCWSNIHGGYVIGRVVIVTFIVMEGIKFLHPALGPTDRRAYRNLLAAGLLGLICSLINPNTYHPWFGDNLPAFSSFFTSDNREYLSSFKEFVLFHDYSMFLYWLFVALAAWGILGKIRKADITEVVLISGTGFFSFVAIRYIPFFMIAALPVIGQSLSRERILGYGRMLVVIIALSAAVFFTWDEGANVRNIATNRWMNNPDIAPVDAAEFIVANDLQGNMYNHYNYGGYLIWRLAPQRKVFIDGRCLDAQVYKYSLIVNNAYAEQRYGMPYWKVVLDMYGVKYIVVPLYEPSGEILPLVKTLIRDDDWALVFFRSNSMIFVKNSAVNSSVMRKFAIPKNGLTLDSRL